MVLGHYRFVCDFLTSDRFNREDMDNLMIWSAIRKEVLFLPQKYKDANLEFEQVSHLDFLTSRLVQRSIIAKIRVIVLLLQLIVVFFVVIISYYYYHFITSIFFQVIFTEIKYSISYGVIEMFFFSTYADLI